MSEVLVSDRFRDVLDRRIRLGFLAIAPYIESIGGFTCLNGLPILILGASPRSQACTVDRKPCPTV
ncbi:MAG: hypothetical protein A2Y36_15605 [Treponema sp. GWA1_62_8]|nr:MAG: hypothetical protein A2Y36_15605 [Treponema sp. GWA1_62_8]